MEVNLIENFLIGTDNKVIVCGVVTKDFEFTNYMKQGDMFVKSEITIKRDSGNEDQIIFMCPYELISQSQIVGKFIRISGRFCSYNKKGNDGRKHLILYIFAEDIKVLNGNYDNSIVLRGYICKKPSIRKTPSGRVITDVLIAQNESDGKTNYIPCIAWGNIAKSISKLQVGSILYLQGRIQSRKYVKKTEKEDKEMTAYEVSINTYDKL